MCQSTGEVGLLRRGYATLQQRLYGEIERRVVGERSASVRATSRRFAGGSTVDHRQGAR